MAPGEPLAVVFGIGVLALDAPRQGKYDRFGVFEFIRVRFQVQQRTHARQQFTAVKRLVEKVVGAGFDPSNPMLGGRESRHHYHGSQPGGGIAFETPADLKPVPVRHEHIQQHQAGLDPRELFQGLLPVARRGHLIPMRLQHLHQ